MARMDKLSSYRTTWKAELMDGSVTYVTTKIVEWMGDYIKLNSNGWQTVTTKRKMCQAANQFGFPFSVFQKKGEWFVRVQGKSLPYYDGIKFNMYTGEVM